MNTISTHEVKMEFTPQLSIKLMLWRGNRLLASLIPGGSVFHSFNMVGGVDQAGWVDIIGRGVERMGGGGGG